MERLNYIVDLYRDADPAVIAAVDRYFDDNGQEAISNLNTLYRSELVPERRQLLEDMLSHYAKRLVIRSLRQMAEQCAAGAECCFMEAGYLLSLLSDPTLRKEDYVEQIMPCAVAVMAEVTDQKTGVENVNLLNHVFYKQFGFTAANPFDMSLDNSLLMKVVENRQGSPFALSLLYFMIAQCASLPVYPLCFTGGFVPVYVENDKILFNINVFHAGEIFLENNIGKMVKSQAAALGVNVDIGEAVVKKDHSILIMYLEYLQMLYSSAGDTAAQMDLDDAIEALGGKRFLTIEEDDEQW